MTEPRVPWRIPSSLSRTDFSKLRTKLLLDACKWDPQVGDTGTLAEFPLLLTSEVWEQLATWSEALTAELLEAEAALLKRPDLFRGIGLPAAVARALGPLPAAPRIMRFDFHWTTDGWRISEVNADVPGGFSEAFELPSLMASHFPETTVAGDPAGAWISALWEKVGRSGSVALLSAPGFLEDLQVVSYLARRIETAGGRAVLTQPNHLRWKDGRLHIDGQAMDAVIRFFQGEWLAGLPRRTGWHHLFGGSRTVVTNPAHTLLSESKRLPLIWNQLGLAMKTWRALLPETREPNEVSWRSSSDWILKSAFSNTGDTVTIRELATPARWEQVSRQVGREPNQWLAQRRFHAVPAETPRGPLYPCIGVYTVEGRRAGIYGRLATTPVVDFRAVDVGVLVERST
jgi:glutathionylspermidine synthase